MARRVITPELFEDEWCGCLSDREQLVWIGLFGVIADDQGRLLDNPALVRARLWPYRDVAVADVAAALDLFVRDGRVHRYKATGKPLMQIVNWWRHQKPQWAQRSSWSAPEGWTDRIRYTSNKITVAEGWDTPGGFLDVQLDTPGGPPQLDTPGGPPSYAHEPEPVPVPTDLNPLAGDTAPAVVDKPRIAGEFESWWAAYGRIGDKARAHDLYRWWLAPGRAAAGQLFAAAANYRAHCGRTDTKMKHAATFLAKPTKAKSAIWPEWATGEEHGSMDVRADGRLNDVLTAGAEAFGLTTPGVDHEQPAISDQGSDRDRAECAPARRGLPAGSLARRK